MATIQTQIQLRLGGAREALQNAAGSSRKASVSHIQKTAANELIADAVAKGGLSSEDIARISDEINEIQWMPGHADELLQSLICKTDKKKRRKQQDFRRITSFMNCARWTAILDPNIDLYAKAYLMSLHGAEMDCINPTEPTYKRWTAEVFAMHYDRDTCRGLSLQAKFALMDHIKKEHKKIVAARPTPAIYMQQLPNDPRSLATENPALFQKLYCDGEEPKKTRLDEAVVVDIDNSFGCRGGGGHKSNPTSTALLPATPAASAPSDMIQLVQCIVQALQQNTRGPLSDMPRGFQRGAHRSLRALQEEPGRWHEGDFPHPGRRKKRWTQEQPTDVHDDDFSHPGRPQKRRTEEQPTERRTAAPPEPPPDADSDEENRENGSPTSANEASESPGKAVLASIRAREQAAKQFTASKAAEARPERAATKGAEKTNKRERAEEGAEQKIPASAREPAPGGTVRKRISSKSKPNSVAGTQQPIAPELPLHPKGTSRKNSKPSMSHERSRFQFLCRVPGKSSEKFTYKLLSGEKAKFPSEAAAKRAAESRYDELKAKYPCT